MTLALVGVDCCEVLQTRDKSQVSLKKKKKEKKIADEFLRIRASRRSASQPTCFKVQKKCFLFLFRSSAGRLAKGWLPRMRREKRLRGNTFCVDPDSGADSHGRRSVSSRWQWSRSHFVQTNNTAVSLSSSQRADRPGSGSRYVTPDQPNTSS